MASVRVLLISTYDLGRQPLGLAGPAAWLRKEGIEADCVDTSREALDDEQVRRAAVVAFYLPMHTATRLAAPLIARARALNPGARLAAYGLYAPLNASWLREQGVNEVLGPEAEQELLMLANSQPPTSNPQLPEPRSKRLYLAPDRSTLPALSKYAALQMPDGTRRVVGTTDTTRGCKHLCRHCPIVPVYEGRFRAVPLEIVMDDIRRQVAAGAQHITFGDPDFFNGPTHARRIVEGLVREFPSLSYDVTIKIEHILRYSEMLALLRETGCVMVTSAVESIDDDVLRKLQKGHTCADFVAAVELCREAALTLAPTFVPFTPWTTIDGYVALLEQIDRLELVDGVAPIQLAIRLLVTSNSRLLELPDIRNQIEPFDPESLSYPWRHVDSRVDDLQRGVMKLVARLAGESRRSVFNEICELAGRSPRHGGAIGVTPPYMTEGWYCCAEPGPELLDVM